MLIHPQEDANDPVSIKKAYKDLAMRWCVLPTPSLSMCEAFPCIRAGLCIF